MVNSIIDEFSLDITEPEEKLKTDLNQRATKL